MGNKAKSLPVTENLTLAPTLYVSPKLLGYVCVDESQWMFGTVSGICLCQGDQPVSGVERPPVL